MKRLCTFVLALAILLTLLPAVRAEGEFRFTRENFPRLDGSTSMVPLGQGIASVLLGESREDAADLICFNRTTQSFRNLCSGTSDIVIAAEPKSDVFQEMAKAAFPYQMEQIATEALVFVVNENNPINSLTAQQVRGIYSGEITNWSQVGGENMPIAAFQRNPTAGSQVMMEKLVMEGTPMMEAPSAMIPQEMGQLIESVRSYDNSANAIGYTVFYYAADMQMAQGLKILQIDGVIPCAQTLRSGEYPFLNGYYACISALAAADSPQRILFSWLTSQEGQDLLALEGYVPVYGPGEAPTAGDGVLTDYSAYAPNNSTPAQFTIFDCPKDHLEPRNDYGDIYPYVGAQLYGAWDDSFGEYQVGSLMGFFNHAGQLITAPIYTNITSLALDQQGEDYLWVVSTGDGYYGYVTRDGSFVSEHCYDALYQIGEYLFASTDLEAHRFQLLDRNLNPVATQDDYTFGGKCYVPSQMQGGLILCCYTDENWNAEYIVLDENHNLLMETQDYLHMDDNNILWVFDENWRCTLLDKELNPVELPEVGGNRNVQSLSGRFYEVTGDDGSYIIDKNGTLFDWNYEYAIFSARDTFTVVKNDLMTLYDARGRMKFTGLDPEWSYLGDDIFTENREDAFLMHNLSSSKTLTFPADSFSYFLADCYYVATCTDDCWSGALVDRELNLLLQSSGDFTTLFDLTTGTGYPLSRDYNGFAGEERLYSTDGKTLLFRANGQLGIQNGYITASTDWAFTCYAPDGNVVFCYPYYGMASGD